MNAANPRALSALGQTLGDHVGPPQIALMLQQRDGKGTPISGGVENLAGRSELREQP